LTNEIVIESTSTADAVKVDGRHDSFIQKHFIARYLHLATVDSSVITSVFLCSDVMVLKSTQERFYGEKSWVPIVMVLIMHKFTYRV